MTNDPPASGPVKFNLLRAASLIVNAKSSFWEAMSWFAFGVGTLTVACFATPFDSGWFQRFGLLFAISGGAWMSGGSLGFLFGVPRYKSSAGEQGSALPAPAARAVVAFTPSTNLEQISDWLTKIIVGATLVQLAPIIQAFSGLCLWIAVQLQNPKAAVFAGGILTFFFFAGFLWGYLWCSIRVFREMVDLTARLQEGD
jgi:hypothetical protein